MQTKNASFSRLQIISSMLVFGTIGIFVKYISLPSSVIAFVRGAVGAIFLLQVAKISKKDISVPAIKKNLFILVLSGVFIGFNWILLFESYRYISVSLATLLYYLAPVFVTVVSPLFLGERLTFIKIVCVLTALCGMIFVTGFSGGMEEGSNKLLGSVLGIGAAVLYASVTLLNKKLESISPHDSTFVQLLSAAVTMLVYNLFTVDIKSLVFDAKTIILLLVVGIIHTGIAYVLYFGSVQKLNAQTVAIISYIDPVFAILLSAIILDETLLVSGIIGSVLILGSTLVSELVGKKKQ